METIEVEEEKAMNDTNAMVQASNRSLAGNAQGAPLSVQEVTQRLTFIKQIMSAAMVEGTDYGTIPGCGDKPTLLQPGAQKLSMTFNLNTEVIEEKVTNLRGDHREYEFRVRVQSANGGKFSDGVGSCSTLESKYRYRQSDRKCPVCAQPTIIKGKEQYGGGYICFTRKGGCGAKFSDTEASITSQTIGRVEFENPADYWNTVRKMAFKRAYIHATINVTNTSQLWTSDLEDIAANTSAGTGGVVDVPPSTPEEPPTTTPEGYAFPPAAPKPAAPKPAPRPETNSGLFGASWRDTVIHFGKNRGTKLGELNAKSLHWYATEFKAEPREYQGRIYQPSNEDLVLKAACDKARAELWPENHSAAPLPDESDNVPM